MSKRPSSGQNLLFSEVRQGKEARLLRVWVSVNQKFPAQPGAGRVLGAAPKQLRTKTRTNPSTSQVLRVGDTVQWKGTPNPC